MSALQSDPFWIQQPYVLIEPSRWVEFWPTGDMTTAEKLNALSRLALFAGIIGSIVTKSPRALYWTIAILVLLVIIDATHSQPQIAPVQTLESMNVNDDPQFTTDCQLPTKENPFMNYLLFGNPDQPPACRGPGVDKVALNLFNDTLFRNVDDLYGRNEHWRDFYTQPSTVNPNDRESFLRWLFFSNQEPYKANPNSTEYPGTPYQSLRQGRRTTNDSIEVVAGRPDNSAVSFPQSGVNEARFQAGIQKYSSNQLPQVKVQQ